MTSKKSKIISDGEPEDRSFIFSVKKCLVGQMYEFGDLMIAITYDFQGKDETIEILNKVENKLQVINLNENNNNI